MAEKRRWILKHRLPSQTMHFLLLLSWFTLAMTGFGVKFGWVSGPTAVSFIQWHVYAGALLTLASVGYVLFAWRSFASLAREMFTWDRDTWLWWTNLGGYPQKILRLGKPKEYPQTKYNAGQKFFGIVILVTIPIVIITGWQMYFFPGALPHLWNKIFFDVHVWLTLFVTLFVLVVHIPLALYLFDDFKGMFRFGAGYVPLEFSEEHSPKWVKRVLSREGAERTQGTGNKVAGEA